MTGVIHLSLELFIEFDLHPFAFECMPDIQGMGVFLIFKFDQCSTVLIVMIFITCPYIWQRYTDSAYNNCVFLSIQGW